MATLGKALRCAASTQRIGGLAGGAGLVRWTRGCESYSPLVACLSTEGASLRKVFQSSAKESASKSSAGRPATVAANSETAVKKADAVTSTTTESIPSSSAAAAAAAAAATEAARLQRDVTVSSAAPANNAARGGSGRRVEGEASLADDASASADEDRGQQTPSFPPRNASSEGDPSPSPLPFHQGNYNYMEFAPRITVVGCGGAGGNAVSNMISRNLKGVEFMVCNTDAQHLSTTLTDNRLQLGKNVTEGLGCGANPDAGRKAATESKDEIMEMIEGSHMVFITAGMGGGTGTGAAPVIAETCMEAGILTVAVVTKPFRFEGTHRMRLAEEGLRFLSSTVDTLIVIPNQNLFQLVDKQTSLLDSFRLADDVLLAGVRSVTDLMVNPGLINLDFADVQAVMAGMGNAMMGTGEAEGEDRAKRAAEDALCNPLLGELSVKSAKGVLVNITGGADMTLFEVDEAATRVTDEVDDDTANIIFGSTYDSSLNGAMRVSVVATGIEDSL